MNAQDAAACFSALQQAGFHYTPEATAGTVALWAEMLRDIRVEDAKVAVIACLKAQSDFPTPFQFRDHAKAAARAREAREASERRAIPETSEAGQRRVDREEALVNVRKLKELLHSTPIKKAP